MNTYLGSLLRFWWVILIGVAAGVGAYTVVLNKVHGFPPALHARFHPTYRASTQLLITSASHPFIRTTTITTQTITQGHQVKTVTGAQAPDITTLINAANLYPRLIQSDEVAATRRGKFGSLPGSISAEPVAGPQFQGNLRASVLPLVQIDAMAKTASAAVALDQKTAEAFQIWLTKQQDDANIPNGQRILVRELRVPTSAVSLGRPPNSLATFAALVTLAGFLLAAIAIDRAFPRGMAPDPGAAEGALESKVPSATAPSHPGA